MPSKKYTYVGAPQYGQTKVKSDTHPDILFKPNKKRAREILSDGIELEPRCMLEGTERRQQAAVTNRGHLIPCCWVDQPENLAHPIMVEMLKVSKISEVESIEEILLSEPWQKFAKNLAEKNLDQVLPVCIMHCNKANKGKNRQKIEEYTYKGKTWEITNPNQNKGQVETYKTYALKEKKTDS